MAKHEHDRLFGQALGAEKRGEWAEAISIYEQLQAELTGQDAGYARNCAIRIREIQEMSRAASASDPGAETTHAGRLARALRPVRWSIRIATALLFIDAAMMGGIGFSAVVAPIWFVISILKNAIQRTGWRLAFLRIAMPPATLAIVMINGFAQYRIGEINSQKIIAACEKFHAVNGEFPRSLEELVPGYLPSVPRARYSLNFTEFLYLYLEGRPLLVWSVIPPYGRYIYSFEKRDWRYMD